MPEPERIMIEGGLVRYDRIIDRDGRDVRVEQSSVVSERTVRLFIATDANRLRYSSAHLTVGQATRLRNALNEFLDDADGWNDEEPESRGPLAEPTPVMRFVLPLAVDIVADVGAAVAEVATRYGAEARLDGDLIRFDPNPTTEEPS